MASRSAGNPLFDRELFEQQYGDPSLIWSIDVTSPPHSEYWRVNEWAENVRTRCYQHGEVIADAKSAFRDEFGGDAERDDVSVLFTPTGTMACRITTSPFLGVGSAMVVNEIAHCVEREGGSVMAQTGSNLYVIRNGKQKIAAAELEDFLTYRLKGFVITQRPTVVSISNPMEDGSVYTPEEVRALAEIAHRHGLMFHVDGARLFLAAARCNESLRGMTTDCDVDLLALGGSKNGMYKAEAGVFLPGCFARYKQSHFMRNAGESWNELRSYLKRYGALVGQAAGTAAQFMRAFHEDFALGLARTSLRRAQQLGEQLVQLSGCYLYRPIESNVVMISIPKPLYEHINERYHELMVFEKTDPTDSGNTVVRFMANYGTTESEIAETVEYVQSFYRNNSQIVPPVSTH